VLAAPAFAGQCAYVTAFDDQSFPTGKVFVLDLETKETKSTILLGGRPRGLALTPNGQELYVVNGGGSSLERGDVSVVNTASNELVQTVLVGRLPISVVISPDGRAAFVFNSCGFDPTCSGLSAISVIDTGSKETIGVIFSKQNTSSYNANCSTNSLAMSPDGRFLYAACMGSRLLIISLAEFFAEPSCPQCSIVGEVEIRSGTVLLPSSVSFSRDGAFAYVGARFGDKATVGVVDTTSSQLTNTIPLPSKNFGFGAVIVSSSFDGRGYVTHREFGGVLPVDFDAGRLGAVIPFPRGEGGRSLAYDFDGRRLLAPVEDAKGVFLLDAVTNEPISVPCVEGTCIDGFLPILAKPFGVTVAINMECPPQVSDSPTPIASPTSTEPFTPSAVASPTWTSTEAPLTATLTPVASATATDGSSPPTTLPSATPDESTRCPGDCNGDQRVSVAELVRGVGVALGLRLIDECQAFDLDRDGRISIAELIRGVSSALEGCPGRGL